MKKIKLALLALMSTLVVGAAAAASACTPKVSLDFNVGGGVAIESVQVAEGSEYALPTPERSGFVFEGWYLTDDFKGEAVTTVTPSENTTFYAKWAQLGTITLNLDGGTLGETTLTLKAGENVYDFMQNYKPTKAGVTFGGWFVGDAELGKNTKMTANGITLTAKYKVEYKIEVYQQAFDSDEYVKVAEDVKGSDFVGKTIVAEQNYAGFEEVQHENAVLELQLSATSSENVLRQYFNRQVFSVVYRSNYPNGAAEETQSFDVKYGTKMNALTDCFACEGYYLAGWATSASGEIVYKTNFLANQVSETPIAGTEFVPETTTNLYAVWKQGKTDIFGGADYIFVDDATPDLVYLCRGGYYTVGKLNPVTKDYEFEDLNGDLLMELRLVGDDSFCFQNVNRNKGYTELVNGGLNDSRRINLDAYNGIDYTETNEDGINSTSKGTYVIVDGRAVATFPEKINGEANGPMAGKQLNFIYGEASDNQGNKYNVFRVRNEEEVALGKMVRFAVYQNTLTYFTNGYYNLSLDGYDTATYQVDAETKGTFNYKREDNLIVLYSTSTGEVAGGAIVSKQIINGVEVIGYYFYNSSLEFTATSATGATLTADGTFNATYTEGGTSYTGIFTVEETVMGDAIMKFIDATGVVRTFMLHVAVNEDESKTYTFETKLNGYKEYHYKDAEATYYAPLVVLDDEVAGKANIYGYTAEKKYVKMVTGSYVYDNATGLYTFTAETYFENSAVSTAIVEYSTINKIVFAVGTTTVGESEVAINYWYTLTTNDEVTTNYEVIYTNGNQKLNLVGGFAIYFDGAQTVTGSYQTNDNLLLITTTEGAYIYLEINASAKTFIVLPEAPTMSYVLLSDGTLNESCTMATNGKGDAEYTVIENDKLKSYVGKVTKTDKTSLTGAPIYKFTSDTLTFEYINLYTSEYTIVAIYYEELAGEYISLEDGALELDGFGFQARYTLLNGNYIDGYYTVDTENKVVEFTVNSYKFYFDLHEGNTFTLRGFEYGAFLLMDNQAVRDVIINLDGYGNAVVTKYDGETTTKLTATYIFVTDEQIKLTYVDGEETVILFGTLGTYTLGENTYNVFITSHTEAVDIYVNPTDLSVLELDQYGNAVRYNKFGAKETGSYTLITDNLLYYLNDAQSDASIYVFDKETGVATLANFTPMGYVSEDLDTLLFTKYGFAVFNSVEGTERFYYNVDNGEVKIYRQDANNPHANKYGFYEQTFGQFAETLSFEDIVFYANDGYAVDFNRSAATKDLYPVAEDAEGNAISTGMLSFAIPFERTYTTDAVIRIGTSDFSGSIIREEYNGVISTYFYYNGLYFELDMHYLGAGNCTYEVVGLTKHTSFYSATYLYYVLMYQYMGMSAPADSFGRMYLVNEYGTDGMLIEENTTFRASFLQSSGITYLDGTLISFRDASFKTTASGLYIITLDHEGVTYRLYFTLGQNSTFGVYEYNMYGVTVVETLTANDGYTVVLEQVIAGQQGFLPPVTLTHNGEVIEEVVTYKINNTWTMITREYDESGLITATKYYYITASKNSDDSETYVPFASATVTSKSITTVYAANGTDYVDLDGDKIVFASIGGDEFIVTDCTYNEATQTYSFTISVYNATTQKYESIAYTAQIVEGKLVATKVEQA